MALDTLDVAEITAAGFGLGVLYQAVEDRVPAAQVDLYTGGIAGLGYLGGLALMHQNSRRGGSGYELGHTLAAGAAALAGAQTTRWVDGKWLKLNVPAGFEADSGPRVDRTASAGGTRDTGSRPGADF